MTTPPQNQPPPPSDSVRRLQVGVGGVVAVLLLVGLAEIIGNRSADNSAAATAADPSAKQEVKAEQPLVELGVQPDTEAPEAPKAAPPPPAAKTTVPRPRPRSGTRTRPTAAAVSDPATAARARSGVGALLYAVLTMGVGYWLGGAAALGRLDAALLIPTLPFAAMAMLALKQVRPVGRIWAILLPTALLLILAFVAFGTTSPHAQWPQLAALGIVSILLLALLGAVHRALASRAAGVRWLIMAALAGASWLAAHCRSWRSL